MNLEQIKELEDYMLRENNKDFLVTLIILGIGLVATCLLSYYKV